MLAEPERTPYDLRFRALGFPVRVHPWFWIGAALLGASWLDAGLQFLLVWIVVVFVSILVHELGHAVAFRAFGSDSDIILYAFGGLAVPTMHVPGRWRRVLISLAGPVAGFLLCAAAYGSNKGLHWATDVAGRGTNGPEVWAFYSMLVAVNLYWGILNLLPVYPLDGGQIARELCGMKWGTRGKKVSLQISFFVATALAAYSVLCALDARAGGDGVTSQIPYWARGSFFTAILFGLLAYTSYQLLQQVRWTDTHWDDRVPWER